MRFAVRNIAPNKVAPTTPPAPTVVSLASGSLRVSWQASWDQDNADLTYALYRDGGATPIYPPTVFSGSFWKRPSLGFTDTGLVAGLHAHLPGPGHRPARQQRPRRDLGLGRGVLDRDPQLSRAGDRRRRRGVLAAVRGQWRHGLQLRRLCRPDPAVGGHLRRRRVLSRATAPRPPSPVPPSRPRLRPRARPSSRPTAWRRPRPTQFRARRTRSRRGSRPPRPMAASWSATASSAPPTAS